MMDGVHGLKPYTYIPLEAAQSFRLLYFAPSLGNSADMHCTLVQFDRSKYCPSYTALSYAWGDVKITVPITLNGQLAYVTHNLHEALLHLRHVRPYLLLWADALSIDQDNESERGHQVSQMRAIYSEASNVISWLGRGTEGTNTLFGFIRGHH